MTTLDHLETQHQVTLSHCLRTSCFGFLCSSSPAASLTGKQGACLIVSLSQLTLNFLLDTGVSP